MTQKAQQIINDCRNYQSFKLDLTDCDIAYLPDFTDIGRHLTVLFIGDNKINDISPLSALVNLSELYMSNNQISDISPLAALTQLRVLLLQHNKITDISPLSGLTNLIDLDISHNQIKDIRPLAGLPNVGSYLTLENNPFNIYPCVDVAKGHKNQAVLDFLRLKFDKKRKIVLESTQEYIESGQLENALKLMSAYFKEEGNKEILLKTLLLSQQVNEVKEKWALGLIEVGYQRTEHARITQALLEVIWEAEM
jgi:Leucine-rich repeat (LRR) protein